jgi:hypothetical protein
MNALELLKTSNNSYQCWKVPNLVSREMAGWKLDLD